MPISNAFELRAGQANIPIELDHLSNVPTNQQVNFSGLSVNLIVKNTMGTILGTYPMVLDPTSSPAGLYRYFTAPNDAFFTPQTVTVEQEAISGNGQTIYRSANPVTIKIIP